MMNTTGFVRKRLDLQSIAYRRDVLDIIHHARRGHLGSAFSIVEVLRTVYESFLQIDPSNPTTPDRDRFILSKGHGCLALYVILAAKGFFPKSELKTFCQLNSRLGGHPDYGKVPGVEASTGSLGHGLSIGVGIALNGKIEGKDYRTVVLMGDGECGEGSVWEAAMSASKHRLHRLTALIDYNRMQCYSATREVQDLEPLAEKWKSFGFQVFEVDGHDIDSIKEGLNSAFSCGDHPQAVICHTVKGKGVRSIENNPQWHHKTKISEAEMLRLRSELES